MPCLYLNFSGKKYKNCFKYNVHKEDEFQKKSKLIQATFVKGFGL